MAIACFVVCLAGPLPAAAQTPGSKLETTDEKTQDKKEKPAPPPRRGQESKKREAVEERPRLDVPVSFPVDI